MNPRLAAARGFTLIELMIVVAIIAILASIVAVNLGNASCRAGVLAATNALKDCKSTIGIWSGPDIQDVLDCLAKAQKAIDKLVASDWIKGNENKIRVGIGQVNRLVDGMAVESQDQRRQLNRAKLRYPTPP